MAGNGYQDISALLKSLTSYSSAHLQPPTQEQQDSAHPYQHLQAQLPPPEQHHDHYTAERPAQVDRPGYYASHHQPYVATQDFAAQQQQPYQVLQPGLHATAEPPSQDVRSQTPTTSPIATSIKPGPDPRTITTWPVALRHITTLLAQNPSVSETVKKLLHNQHENERSWWASRQALLRQQAARKSGQEQLADVLRSVGAQPSSDAEVVRFMLNAIKTQDPEAELKRHDHKVHAAAVKMVDAMSADLQALGIPFFGLRSELLSETDAPGASSDGSKISRADLARLQKRMLAFLEDYCKD